MKATNCGHIIQRTLWPVTEGQRSPLLKNAQLYYDICRRNLDIERPTYTNLNHLITQALPFSFSPPKSTPKPSQMNPIPKPYPKP